jgi:hypothetical protein
MLPRGPTSRGMKEWLAVAEETISIEKRFRF